MVLEMENSHPLSALTLAPDKWIEQQVPHPLKKRGFGMTCLGVAEFGVTEIGGG
jgi:hypothetical protein